MKKYLILLAIPVLLFSCKKDKKDSTPKDYRTLLINSIWTGEFNYTGKPTQVHSILFLGGGKFEWRELQDSTTGTWKSENDLVTVTFKSGASFTANIANDNNFVNIKNLATNGFTVTSATLNNIPVVPLEGTVFTGTNIVIRFKPKYVLDLEIGPTGATKYLNVNYTNIAKTIKFNASGGAYRWAMIFNTATTLKGNNVFSPEPTLNPVSLTKQ